MSTGDCYDLLSLLLLSTSSSIVMEGGIYNTLKDCALISKWAGGIGLHIVELRLFGYATFDFIP